MEYGLTLLGKGREGEVVEWLIGWSSCRGRAVLRTGTSSQEQLLRDYHAQARPKY